MVISSKRVRVPNYVRYVEYLESTGAQYIDTGFKPNKDTRVVMDCDIIRSSGFPTAFGTWNGGVQDSFIYIYSSSSAGVYYYGNKGPSFTIPSYTGRKLVDANKNVLSLDGMIAATAEANTFTSPYNLYLFTMNENNAPRTDNMTSMRLYSCQIYDHGTLVRDYWPCFDQNGVACLYDKVSASYFYNAGSGDFLVGGVPEKMVTFVEYIESTGTQYIDTGVKALATVDADFKVQLVGSGASDVFDEVYDGSDATTVTFLYAFKPNFIARRGGSGYTNTIPVDNNVHEFFVRSDHIIADGTRFALASGAAAPNLNRYMFCENLRGSATAFGKFKLYYAKYYNNGVLFRDYWPCLDHKGVACLYDKISGAFFYNQGTGEFIAGGAA